MLNIQFEKLIPISEITGEDKEDRHLILNSLAEARDYIKSYKWCEQVTEEYLGIGIGGVVSVFLFKIVPKLVGVDEYIWVITGDLPPAYITCEDAPNAACALDGYIGAMEEWVETIQDNKSVGNLIPVNTPPTNEYASMLESRLKFLTEEILSSHEKDLTY